MPQESLAEFELLVMLAALRLGPEEAYTVSIADDIRRRTGRSVRRANVLHPAYALIHVRGSAATDFGSRLRALAFEVDPTLRIGDVQTLARVDESTVEFYRFWVIALMMGSAVGLVLSLGGIYAVMSFTVARRTREIGVRVALGASAFRVVRSVLRQPLRQVALGILVGGVLLIVLFNQAALPSWREVAVFVGYTVAVTLVCLLACIVPTRRALSVEPSEALRAEL